MRATVRVIDASHDADTGNVILVGRVTEGDVTCKPGDTAYLSDTVTAAESVAVDDSKIAPVARNTPSVAVEE